MRMVYFSELMEMPVGTIYQEYEPHDLGDPHVFGGAVGDIDFSEASLMPTAGFASYWQDPAVLQKWGITKDDMVIYYPSNFGRDALFNNPPRRFLIWEDEDRKKMAAWLLDPTTVAEQNDDPHALIRVTE